MEPEKHPLRQDTENPPEALSTDSKKSGNKSSSALVNKRNIIIAAIIIVILLILVIVLGALLGAERANRKDEESNVEANKGGPVTTSEPGPTTPGTEVWWNVRLPKNIVPDHYDVALTIDLKKLEYYGSVKIKVNVTEPTKIVLVHVKKMNVTSASMEKASGGDSLSTERQFRFEKNQFYVMVMKSDLEVGQYVTKMEFKAWLTDDLGGLYRSTYMKNDGTSVTIASTQFQATDARRAFPCFDEPAMKATFTITLGHDPNLIAVSNMPIASHEIKDNWRYDHFEKTKKMSTYLIAFLVCDFASKTRTSKGGTKMTFYASADQIDQVDYAADVGVAVLDYYEDYFKIPYPLPKADMVAVPNLAFGAMENWGLIFYRESTLLYQPGASSEFSKQLVAAVVAHELAHQWFGNLVTMEWWDDLWLNEGFASFATYYGVNPTEPNWGMLNQFIIDDLAPAFLLDGLASSHPIRIAVNHPDQINEIFDEISYSKGASIIRMLQEFLGRVVFLQGLTNYLNKYRFGNARTDDLWNALEKESCVQGNCKNVKQMMDTWTLQMGYPVVHIKDIGGGKFRAAQERFLFDPNANVSSKYETKFNYKWVVPFTYFTSDNATLISKPMNMTSVEIDWDGNGWLKGNVGQTGFYRVNYEPRQWDKLAGHLYMMNFEVTDRGGLIDDAFNLARGGVVKYSVPLKLTEYIEREVSYVPWKAFESNLGFIQKILPSSSPASKYLKKYLQYQAKFQYSDLGFKDVGSHLEIYMRGVILRLMCGAGEATCLNNTSEQFKDWMEDPVGNPVPANFRSLVYYYGIANGGIQEWDFAFEQFKKTAVPSERINIMSGLAGSKEPWILMRYLQYSLDPEKIRSQDTSRLIQYVANDNPIGRQAAWQFVKLNWDSILKKFGGGFRHLTRIIEGVTGGFATDFELSDLKAFIEKNPDAGSGVRALQQAVERVVANIKWRKDNEQDIEKWLKDFLLTKNIPLN